MRIGEVSKIVGISNSAIRFYERHGLLNAKKITRSKNGYRVYTPEDVNELHTIIKFKEFGLELKKIKQLLSKESSSCGDLLSTLSEQLEKYRQMEKDVQERIQLLLNAKSNCRTKCEPGNKLRTCQAR